MKKSILLLALSGVLLSGCKKDEESVTPTPTNTGTVITSTTAATFSATINGNAVSYTVDNSTYYETYGSSGSVGDTTFQVYSGDISKRVGTDFIDLISIRKGTLSFIGGFDPDTATFSNFFNAGTFNFSDDAENGIELNWFDSNNVLWTTSGINQSGSTFVIEKKISYEFLGYFYARYKAKFNCKLTNGVQTITLTNGSMIGSFTY